MRAVFLHILVASALLLAACDTFRAPDNGPEVVVEAYLTAGEPLSSVRLTRTIGTDDVFDADALGIVDADVRIELMAPNGDVVDVLSLAPVPERPGLYTAVDAHLVLPLRSYRFVAEVPGYPDLVTSTTTVPGEMRVLRVNRDSVEYRSDQPLQVHLSEPVYPGRQSFFVLTTSALDASESTLTPFAEVQFEDGTTIAELTESVSPLINEETFEAEDDGSLRVQYPWLGVNFYGRNRVSLQALDDNLYDFLRSQSVQQSGSTLPPGEIPNVLDRVDGGRGIFGSFARASVEFVVLGASGS